MTQTADQTKPCTCDANADSQDTCQRHGAQTQHTPGPWMAEDWGPSYQMGMKRQLAITAGNERITMMDSNMPGPVVEANARLIAAAPAMLDALTMAEGTAIELGRLARTRYPMDVPSLLALVDAIAREARAAIRKATE